jgi:hypothetical protein
MSGDKYMRRGGYRLHSAGVSVVILKVLRHESTARRGYVSALSVYERCVCIDIQHAMQYMRWRGDTLICFKILY